MPGSMKHVTVNAQNAGDKDSLASGEEEKLKCVFFEKCLFRTFACFLIGPFVLFLLSSA